MPRIRVRTGLNLYYESYGAGPPVLFMNGVGARWVWFKTVPALSRYFRVITLDIRGTGGSDKPIGPYTVATLVLETVDVIRALGLGRTHLVGMSLGGAVAMEIALRYPALAGKLVLVGATPGGRAEVPTPPAIYPLLFPLRELTPLENFYRTIQAALSPEYIATHPAELATIARLAEQAPTPPYTRLSIGFASVIWPGIVGRSGFIRNPTLVVAGERDLETPVENSFRLAQLLPNAQLVLFPGAGHLFQIEQADAFNRLLIDFLTAPVLPD